jgi:hypothetical protein
MECFVWENEIRRLLGLIVGNSLHGVSMCFYGRQNLNAVGSRIDHSVFLQMCTNKRLWWRETQNNTSQPTRSNEKTLLEKLIVPQPVKNYPAVYGARRFINVLQYSPKILPFPSQMNPFRDCPSCLCNVHCNIIVLTIPSYSQRPFPFWLHTTTTHSNTENGIFTVPQQCAWRHRLESGW